METDATTPFVHLFSIQKIQKTSHHSTELHETHLQSKTATAVDWLEKDRLEGRRGEAVTKDST